MSEPLPFRLRWTLGLRESYLSSRAKLAGFVVVSYMNDEGAAWPSLAALERGTSLSRKTVIAALEELDWVGFITKVRGQHSNTYFPQLTPDIERLVHDFLENARRRGGQLPLPLDSRGLHAIDGSRVESFPRQSGTAPAQSGPTPPEVVREVVTEVAQACADDNLSDPLVNLVSDLHDRDAGTLHVFRKTFGDLSAWSIEHAHDELRRRRNNSNRPPLVSEARYAFDALLRQKAGAA